MFQEEYVNNIKGTLFRQAMRRGRVQVKSWPSAIICLHASAASMRRPRCRSIRGAEESDRITGKILSWRVIPWLPKAAPA
jgi:hypothetical protein